MTAGGAGPLGEPGAFAAYVICGTPRSGSTLLCGMLRATGVAGNPNSYFRAEDVAGWAEFWGVPMPGGPEGPDFDRAYLAALRREASAGTGVVGLRLMWDSVGEASRRLGHALGTDADLVPSLREAFGPTLFIALSRGDRVAQAVSRLRAEQSGLWHRSADGSVLEEVEPTGPVGYDGARLRHLVRELEDHSAAWDRLFARHGIEPLRLSYEALAADPKGTLGRVLAALGKDAALARDVPVPTARLADGQSRLWMERFAAERGD